MDKQKNGMVSRREFLQSTVAVSALAAPAGAAAWAVSAPNAVLDGMPGLSAFVVDRSLPWSRDFVIHAERLALPVKRMDSDPGSVWMHDIEPRLRQRRGAVAGYTSEATLFCLQFLARDYGVNVVYRIAHLHRRAHDCEHVLEGTPAFDDRSDPLRASGLCWPSAVVSMAASWRNGTCTPRDTALIDLRAPMRQERPFALSWLMARRDHDRTRRG